MLQLSNVQFKGRGCRITLKNQRNNYRKKIGRTSHFSFSCINNAPQGQLAFGEWFLVRSSTTSEAK